MARRVKQRMLAQSSRGCALIDNYDQDLASSRDALHCVLQMARELEVITLTEQNRAVRKLDLHAPLHNEQELLAGVIATARPP